MKGKIVLVPFPFTDLTAAKLRPALVIYEGERDVVIAFVSSKTTEPSEASVLIGEDHPGFKRTGLKRGSVVRLDKVATVLKDLVIGELGDLDAELREDVNQRLRKIFEV